MVRIKIQPQEIPRLKISLPSQPTIRLEAIVKRADGETYDGEYEVTPDFDTQKLETASKIMREDVTVYPIPVYRTTNPTGGNTVFIGGILDG